MIAIELLERRVRETGLRLIPLENLEPTSLDYLLGLGCSMTAEIFHSGSQLDHAMDRVRKCDDSIVSSETSRVIVIKNILLLVTVLQGKMKEMPHLRQLVDWLNESEHTHKGDMWIRVIEYVEKDEVEVPAGPETLTGIALEEAMSSAPRGGIMQDELLYPEPEVDRTGLFDEDCADLHASPEPEDDASQVLDEFFAPYLPGEDIEFTLELTEEV